ncbi:GNAT family N-acetyltransferase [Rubrivivax gelatinosus]|uniref:Acetyltransferase (GNAT) family protein n=1 Tax=Rubrivivax gelatinosus TaxID=28068 RepID=A0A4R2MJX2_RUBGE|nr:GNAT family N-acetyltransferase [Rubrivivax gelatinosus]MBK1686689.1 GNAT family N-acetyltransferase [Rubrivivax gelatinosus]TCP05287.1 acetyltransferase (GNAT) family protein [Rubrivivax gelatinosus]
MPTAPSIATRSATEADLPLLVALRRGFGADGDDAELAAQLRGQLDGSTIVLLDGHPVGLLRVHRGSRDWAIQQVQLLPGYRRAGIGSRLIGEVLAEARAQGARVSLSVLKANPARSLYERLGFTVTAECENGYSMRACP